MLPNKKEFTTKINKITIEAETETENEDKEKCPTIIECTSVLPEGISGRVTTSISEPFLTIEINSPVDCKIK